MFKDQNSNLSQKPGFTVLFPVDSVHHLLHNGKYRQSVGTGDPG